MEHSVHDAEVGVGWNHIGMIGLDPHLVFGGRHPDLARSGQKLRQETLVIGSEMLDDDESHAVEVDAREEISERFESAGRRADSDDEKPGRQGRARTGIAPVARRRGLSGLDGWIVAAVRLFSRCCVGSVFAGPPGLCTNAFRQLGVGFVFFGQMASAHFALPI